MLLKQQGYHVYATCRTSTDALQAVGVQVITGALSAHCHIDPSISSRQRFTVTNLMPAGVDLEDDNCQQPVLQALGSQKVHLLLVVAGLQHYDTLKTLDRKLVRQQLEVNAVGPLFLVQALQQNLAAAYLVQPWADTHLCRSCSNHMLSLKLKVQCLM